MNWFVLALISPALLTVVYFIDKYVIESKVKDYRGMPIYGAISGGVVGTLFWLFSGQPILSQRDTLLVIFSGVISLFAYYLYFNALAKSNTSYIIILFQTTPILTLILAFLFLKETITIKQLVGFALILSSAIALSLEKRREKFTLSSSLYLILLSNLLLATAAILIKFTINANSFSKIFSYESWGIALGGLLLYSLFPIVRKAFIESFISVGQKVLSIMFFNELIFVTSKATQFLAIALGPVALVSVLGSTQTFYGIIYGAMLTLLVPRIFKEDISKNGLLQKIAASVVLLFGMYLIS